MNQPHLYARTNFVIKNISKRALEDFGAKMNWKPNGASIVDIGTGTGDLFVEDVLPKIPSYKQALGLDTSPEMVKYANKHYSNIPKIKFAQGDISGFDVKPFENQFDYATSFFCLMLVPDQEKALKNICKMMKVGGKCLFVLVVSSSVYEPWKKLAKSDKWGKYLTHHFVSPYYGLTHPIAKMENHLKTAGFSQFEAILNDDNDFYEDVNGVKDFIKSIPCCPLVPKEMKKDFFDEFFQCLEDEGFSKNGGCFFPLKTMTVFGVK